MDVELSENIPSFRLNLGSSVHTHSTTWDIPASESRCDRPGTSLTSRSLQRSRTASLLTINCTQIRRDKTLCFLYGAKSGTALLRSIMSPTPAYSTYRLLGCHPSNFSRFKNGFRSKRMNCCGTWRLVRVRDHFHDAAHACGFVITRADSSSQAAHPVLAPCSAISGPLLSQN
jgi:hypothetical protein